MGGGACTLYRSYGNEREGAPGDRAGVAGIFFFQEFSACHGSGGRRERLPEDDLKWGRPINGYLKETRPSTPLLPSETHWARPVRDN